MEEKLLQEADRMVEENFKGLWYLIDDEHLSFFYKEMIKTCMVEFSKQTSILQEEDTDPIFY